MNYKIPLEEIIDCKENVYKMTTIAMKEALVLTKMDPDLYKKEYGNSKVTAVALSKALNGEVKYTEKSLDQLDYTRKKKK